MKRALRTQTQTTVNTQQATQTDKFTHAQSDKNATTAIKTEIDLQVGEEEIMTTRVYDTSKPISQATGMPPLQSETTTTRRKGQKSHQTQTIDQVAQSNAIEDTAESASSTSNSQANTTTVQKDVQKRGMNDMQRTLCGLGILVLVYFGGKLLLKRIKPL